MSFKLKDIVIFNNDGKKIEGEVSDVSSDHVLVGWVESDKKNYCSVLKKKIILHKPKKNIFFKRNNLILFLITVRLKTKLSIFKTKPQQKLNKTTTKQQQKRNKNA
jgi:hypothetical protein